MRRGITKSTPALRAMASAMSGATVLACDNVTEYYYVLNDQEDWVFPTDFPNVAPPFSNFFVETERPSKMVSREYGVQEYDGADRWGFWMKVTDMKNVRDEVRAHIFTAVQKHGEYGERLGQMLVRESRWIIEALNFFCYSKDAAIAEHNREADVHIGTAGKCFMFVRDDGTAIQFETNFPGEAWLWTDIEPHTIKLEAELKAVAIATDYGKRRMMLNGKLQTVQMDPNNANHCREFFRGMLQPCLLALCFANCKNVVTVNEQAPRQQRRAAEREGRPLTVYKTLQIAPIERAVRARGEKGQSGIKLRMHIRRGRFRDYREGRGLFGKHHGLYWWEPQVLGDPKMGVIEKDYSIAPKTV